MLEKHILSRRLIVQAAFAAVAVPQSVVGQSVKTDARRGGNHMKVRCSFGGNNFTVSLFDNPPARDFASMLPLDLEIEDYSTNEKIAYLPRKLTEEGSGPFSGEAPGDLCYYAPWGNLAFFHGSYRYSKGLIRLGRLDAGPAPLLTKGKFLLRLSNGVRK